MKTTIETISPSIAKKMLESNAENRPLKPSYIEGIADSIRRGEWRLTHQGICISKSGRLLDGQHRLLAIVEANKSVQMMVTRGAEEEIFDSLDIGKHRSVSDVLGVDKNVAAIARWLALVEEPANKPSMTPQFLIPYIHAAEPYFRELFEFCPKTTRIWSSSVIRAAAITKMMDGEDKDYVNLVYYALNHAEFDAMPPVAQSLFRQSLEGKIRGQSTDLFVRCLKVFDRRYRDMTKIQVKSPESGIQYARAVIAEAVHGKKTRPQQSAASKATKVGKEFSRVSA